MLINIILIPLNKARTIRIGPSLEENWKTISPNICESQSDIPYLFARVLGTYKLYYSLLRPWYAPQNFTYPSWPTLGVTQMPHNKLWSKIF